MIGMHMESNQANSAALRAFRILELIAESEAPPSLADIVARMDLPKQTVHRLLQQLQDSWLVTRTPGAVSYTHLRAHETVLDLVCRLLLLKKNQTK